MSNTAWSYARLEVMDLPLLDAIAQQARRKIFTFDAQALSNTAWAFARLGLTIVPLLHSISQSALNILSDFDTQHLANLAWSIEGLQFSFAGSMFLRFVERFPQCE